MTREEIIRNLKYTMEKHKNDTVNTFDTNVSVMCKDILEYLEQEPCEDAISKRAINILVDELARAISDERCCMSRGRSTATIMQDILDLPSVKPQTGHWRHYEGMLTCSECGAEFYDDIMEYCGDDAPKCCPDCGARMEVEQNG